MKAVFDMEINKHYAKSKKQSIKNQIVKRVDELIKVRLQYNLHEVRWYVCILNIMALSVNVGKLFPLPLTNYILI